MLIAYYKDNFLIIYTYLMSMMDFQTIVNHSTENSFSYSYTMFTIYMYIVHYHSIHQTTLNELQLVEVSSTRSTKTPLYEHSEALVVA